MMVMMVIIMVITVNNNNNAHICTFQRQSYEWYIPKGILKSNWIPKYLYHVPALVVLFYDLDWNDSSWTEKKNEVASQVQSLK